MFYEPSTGRIFATHSDVRSAMPGVIFGGAIMDDDLAARGVFPLAYVAPDAGPGQIAVPVAVEQLEDGTWAQVWDVRAASADEVEQMKPPVPQTVTRRQARQALLLAGLLDDVPAAIEAIPDLTARRMAQIEWEDSLEFVRSRPLVVQIGAALGLDEAELDQLFIAASSL